MKITVNKIIDNFCKKVPNGSKYFVDYGRNSVFVQTTDGKGFDYKISDIVSQFETICKNKNLNIQVLR